MSKSKLNQSEAVEQVGDELDDDELLAMMAEVEDDLGEEAQMPDEEVAVEDAPPEEELETDDETLAEAEASVERAENRATMIEDSAKTEAVDPDTVAKPAAAKTAAAKRTATPRQSFSTCSEAVLAKIGQNYSLLGADDQVAAKTQAEAFDNLAKKVKEKVINIFDAATAGKKLSNYTQMAMDLLAANGELTVAQLKEAYIARPYSQGTANSQAHQISQLLPALGLVTKTGSTMQLVEKDNPLLKALMPAQAA
jgi:hypothetical protein